MSQISKLLRDVEDGGLLFWCPGCDGAHLIKHGAGAGPRWSWNGDVNKPTFTPSVLVNSTKLTELGELQRQAWTRLGYPKLETPLDSKPTVCHSFVTDGRIQFLTDCTHSLVGKTVDLQEWDAL
jgi:hypothetical protein